MDKTAWAPFGMNEDNGGSSTFVMLKQNQFYVSDLSFKKKHSCTTVQELHLIPYGRKLPELVLLFNGAKISFYSN
ncbi:hypothetical protein NAT51_11925 [Flavobacterium amniphilum]|uniref:hypothetical protein n=1 Tax=Flavobacterium amniphilum TaxID=1834035 RepID=UPI002029D6DC|nr:hypothetical protein [Flavobacterium amniphilum]MCL9806235.1 hypothetical protein [Flavobacterium amniphilum]